MTLNGNQTKLKTEKGITWIIEEGKCIDTRGFDSKRTKKIHIGIRSIGICAKWHRQKIKRYEMIN